jgi:FMN phosphatase YigB (HAD superfamily)
MLDDVERRYPAEHYVMVDDKLWILASMKQHWGSRLTTVWVAQGRYASDPMRVEEYPAADIRLDRIADLAKLCLTCLVPRAAKGAGAREGR